jgi:ferritin-like metal-binding protein YciE
MASKTLNDLFLDELKDIYFAEKQIYRTLPKLAKAARATELHDAFLLHREQTEGQIARLETIFEMLDKPARGKTCEAIKGILEEGEEMLEDYKDSDVLDAALIGSAKAVEHYEMARYGTLKMLADKLRLPKAAKLLAETLQEEQQTDVLLGRLAETETAAKAA